VVEDSSYSVVDGGGGSRFGEEISCGSGERERLVGECDESL
jgi:hypothetical protein